MMNPIPYTVNADVKLRPSDLYSHRRTDIPGVKDECIFFKTAMTCFQVAIMVEEILIFLFSISTGYVMAVFKNIYSIKPIHWDI